MVYFKCTSIDPAGAAVETHHPVLDLAIYEGARRKSQGHADVTIASVNDARIMAPAPAIPTQVCQPFEIVNPGDIPGRVRARPKKQRSSRSGTKLSVMDALSGS